MRILGLGHQDVLDPRAHGWTGRRGVTLGRDLLWMHHICTCMRQEEIGGQKVARQQPLGSVKSRYSTTIWTNHHVPIWWQEAGEPGASRGALMQEATFVKSQRSAIYNSQPWHHVALYCMRWSTR